MSIYATQTDTDFGQVYNHPSPQKVAQFNDILKAMGIPEVSLDSQPNKHNKIMSKQMTALDQVRQGGYIVGSIDTNATVSFSGTPRIHNTAQEARLECKRLAASQPGKAFIFVKLAGAELVPQATAVSI